MEHKIHFFEECLCCSFPLWHLKVRSHRTWMKRYAQMIYMLSQCKDAIDNPAALFARIRRHKLRDANWASWKIWSLADIRVALTNKDLALAVTSKIRNNNVIVVVCGYSELYDTTSYFYKNRNTFCIETGAAWQEAPPMTRICVCCVVNLTREWCKFHARMKRVNSNCSSVQLRTNSAIYSLHSRLVWTHL